MITDIHIDNYKCFVNFDCRPGPLQLMLGGNGSGKTAVFDLLETLRDFVCEGTETVRAFPADTLTAWDTRPEQTLELGIQGNGGQYRYRLVVQHQRAAGTNGIKTERLEFDEKPLYEFRGNEVHLHRDDQKGRPTQFPFDKSRSALSTIPERSDNKLLTWFRQRLAKVYVFSPDPLRITGRSELELEKPDRRLHDLVSWLRHLSQESTKTVTGLYDCLRNEVIEGLVDVKIEKLSESARALKCHFDFASGEEKKRFKLSLEQLSEGQRNLVALYAVLHGAVERDATVCIDEPDNYVALRELQPWVALLRDRVEDTGGQCLLISHHPELINYLAAGHGLRFYRDPSGPARAKKFDWQGGDAIAPAEIVARGWE